MQFNQVLENVTTYEAGKPIELVVREYGVDPKDVIKLASTCDKITDIKKIYSKDIAFEQCKKFLTNFGLDEVELIPIESTTKAAKIAASEPFSAAICPHVGAKLHNLPILFENI